MRRHSMVFKFVLCSFGRCARRFEHLTTELIQLAERLLLVSSNPGLSLCGLSSGIFTTASSQFYRSFCAYHRFDAHADLDGIKIDRSWLNDPYQTNEGSDSTLGGQWLLGWAPFSSQKSLCLDYQF